MVVAAYGLILPPAVLEIPTYGCLNIHASLLPRWRGAAPIQRALLAGDGESGITIMQMNAGLDTGNILLRESTPITIDDTAQSLHDRLARMGAHCIVRALREQPVPIPQDEALASYAGKIAKSEAVIDWSLAATEICRRVRAFNPVPGAMTTFDGATLKIWSALTHMHAWALPGKVLSAGVDGVVVAAGESAVRILELQKAGGRRMSAAAFLSGTRLQPGAQFGP
jgi:methionyl-tRNA formyltransferase